PWDPTRSPRSRLLALCHRTDRLEAFLAVRARWPFNVEVQHRVRAALKEHAETRSIQGTLVYAGAGVLFIFIPTLLCLTALLALSRVLLALARWVAAGWRQVELVRLLRVAQASTHEAQVGIHTIYRRPWQRPPSGWTLAGREPEELVNLVRERLC